MKHLILPLFTLAWAVSAQAGSDRVLSGSVADANGETIPGANIVWLGSKTGTSTDLQGAFSLKRTGTADRLVVSCIGFATDTLTIAPEQEYIDIVLREGMELAEVNVTARKITLGKLRSSVMNTDMVSREELFRAACCNLGESFVTNPSVDVNYSDAATGAKQIRLLGLSGTYVQLLTENIPNFRGASAPYALGYVPGPWMQSIQVSKGTSSVKNGYEALTGQINIEFKKPQAADADWVSANLFGSTTGRYEANADASVKLTDKWSTMLLAHYENETRSHDANDDGFADIPMVEQYNLFNRWAYMGDRYIFQAGIKALREDRTSGQVSHGGHSFSDPYRVGINTDRYEGFLDAHRARGLTPDERLCLTGPFGLYTHYEEISAFLNALDAPPDGFVCASDYIAHYIQQYYDDRGLPRTVPLTGFDNNTEYANVADRITTVDTQTPTIGARLAMHILFRLANPDAACEVCYLTTRVIDRTGG